jgi:hypothetical protein
MLIITWILALLMLFGVVGIQILKFATKLDTYPENLKKEAEYFISIYNMLDFPTRIYLSIVIGGTIFSEMAHKLINIGRDGMK